MRIPGPILCVDSYGGPKIFTVKIKTGFKIPPFREILILDRKRQTVWMPARKGSVLMLPSHTIAQLPQ
jgi:hypothetical protein